MHILTLYRSSKTQQVRAFLLAFAASPILTSATVAVASQNRSYHPVTCALVNGGTGLPNNTGYTNNLYSIYTTN
jgi:hypothetical protein